MQFLANSACVHAQEKKNAVGIPQSRVSLGNVTVLHRRPSFIEFLKTSDPMFFLLDFP